MAVLLEGRLALLLRGRPVVGDVGHVALLLVAVVTLDGAVVLGLPHLQEERNERMREETASSVTLWVRPRKQMWRWRWQCSVNGYLAKLQSQQISGKGGHLRGTERDIPFRDSAAASLDSDNGTRKVRWIISTLHKFALK